METLVPEVDSVHEEEFKEEEEEEIPQVFPVRVAVHVRPLLPQEEKFAAERVSVTADESDKTVQLPATAVSWSCREESKRFTYDYVYKGSDVDQQGRESTDRLYEQCVLPLLDGCFQGLNATVLAYGQTGSGKTYTMGSSSGAKKGVIPRVARDLFERVRTKELKEDVECTITVSFFEVYREVLSDLLLGTCYKQRGDPHGNTNPNLCIREDVNKNVFVAGLTQIKVASEEELIEQLITGCLNRATGSTEMNKTSSRSHAVFTISVRTVEKSKGMMKTSKFHLVDLAGSERAKKTKARGQRLAEGIDINLGLLALGNVISALGGDSKSTTGHVPYRDSKLTRILQDSLGGNSRTLMVACISPSENNFEESLSTLRYANRARRIKNKPRKNNQAVDLRRVISDLRKRNANLQEELSLEKVKNDESMTRTMVLSNQVEQLKFDLAEKQKLIEETVKLKEAEQQTHIDEIENSLDELEAQHKEEIENVKQEYEDKLQQLQQQLDAKLMKKGCIPTKFRSPFSSPFRKHNKKEEEESSPVSV